MVGNYVHVNGGLITVDDIISDYGINMHHDCWLHDLKDITPIPITEEWLQKFGFLEVPIDHPIPNNKSFEKNALHIKIYSSSDIKKIWYNEMVIDNNYYYVHQLQNLYFALTGQELTIKQ